MPEAIRVLPSHLSAARGKQNHYSEAAPSISILQDVGPGKLMVTACEHVALVSPSPRPEPRGRSDFFPSSLFIVRRSSYPRERQEKKQESSANATIASEPHPNRGPVPFPPHLAIQSSTIDSSRCGVRIEETPRPVPRRRLMVLFSLESGRKQKGPQRSGSGTSCRAVEKNGLYYLRASVLAHCSLELENMDGVGACVRVAHLDAKLFRFVGSRRLFGGRWPAKSAFSWDEKDVRED
ncbi:hypothetical protein GWI33_013968 [Rhynchophorus ferrugineus]|uniref:Uncharacterized protein n=1 Tax=Rhynchophorus ferrugineus TaxID=354439 RepID=A0A834MCS8_RHYFE|nr:hypothetical protein GWI33_013968 [Rhynchophorus ferrugineus]